MILWTPTLMLLVPMFLQIALLYVWIFYKKRSNRKFPFSDAVLRNPGETLSNEINDLSFDFAVYFPLMPLTLVTTYAYYLQIGIDTQKAPSLVVVWVIFSIAALVIASLIVKIIKTINKLQAYRIGYAGEVAVGNALNQLMLQGYRVFHDIQGDKRFNIDHLLIGPSGVFAIETKTKTKMKNIKGKQVFKVKFDGKSLYFPDRTDLPHKAFLEQARRNAKWVSKWLTEATGSPVKAQPVLVLPGWFIEVTKPGDVRVLNHNQVQALTSMQSRAPLDKPVIEQIAYQIQQRCQNKKIVPYVLSN